MDLTQMRVLLAQSDPREEARLTRALSGCREVTVCRDCRGVLEALHQGACDALVMPLAICGADARQVCAEICALHEISCPAMIVLLPEGLARSMRRHYNEEVVCMEGETAEDGALLEAINALTEADRLTPDWADEARIRRTLDRMSIPRGLKGYTLLVRAVRLLAKNGRLIGRLASDVYPFCEEGVSGAAAEKAMRRAIETAWLKGDLETQYRLFGNTIDEAKGKPTNAEFLSRVVETLRMEA